MKDQLKQLLDKYKTVLFVGIGNVLKQDDGVGVYISQMIQESDSIRSLTVEQSLENYIGKINQLKPGALVFIDCLFFNEKPGYADIVSADEILEHTTNTHNVSLKRIAEFFKMPVIIIGIQPGSVRYGEGLTPKVLKAADEIIKKINALKK